MSRALAVAAWAVAVAALVLGWSFLLVHVLRLGLVPTLLLGGAGGFAVGLPAGRALWRLVHRRPLFPKGNHHAIR